MKNTPENVRLLRDVLRKEAPALLRRPGVRDVRVGLKEEDGALTRSLCIQVLVKQKTPPEQLSPRDMIRVSGYPTDVIEIGPRDSLGDHDDCPTVGTAWAHDGRAPFVQGGVNIQKEGTSEQGTLGMFVYDALDPFPVPHILTCAHVIADRATRSDYENVYVTQGSPGTEDRIAEVTRSVYRKPAGPGLARTEIDAALARVVDGDRELRAGILELEDFEPIILEPSLGMAVVKQGARTGITEGMISAIAGNLIHFQRKSATGVGDEILVCSGDSGSVLLGRTAQGKLRPVGLVIAQVTYDLGGFYRHWGIATRFSTVAKDLKIRLEPQGGCFHRYWNDRWKRSAYVPPDAPSPQELHPDYELVDPAFGSLSPADPDVVPLYCYYNSSFQSHFYTTDRGAEGMTALGYAFAGTAGYLSLRQTPDSELRALRRYVNAARHDYALAIDGELAPVPDSGYTQDVGHARPATGARMPAAASQPPKGWVLTWAKPVQISSKRATNPALKKRLQTDFESLVIGELWKGLKHAPRWLRRWMGYGAENRRLDEALFKQIEKDNIVANHLNKRHLAVLLGRGSDMAQETLNKPPFDITREYGVSRLVKEPAFLAMMPLGAETVVPLYWTDSLQYPSDPPSEIFWCLHGFTLKSDWSASVKRLSEVRYQIRIKKWSVTLTDQYDFKPPEGIANLLLRQIIESDATNLEKKVYRERDDKKRRQLLLDFINQPSTNLELVTTKLGGVSNQGYGGWLMGYLYESRDFARVFAVKHTWVHSTTQQYEITYPR